MTDRPGTQCVIDLAADPELAIDRATLELTAGRIVVIPTDTIYGIAAAADDKEAVASILEAKRRPTERRIAVLVADIDQARSLVLPTTAFTTLATQFWPGPLTLVASRRPDAPSAGGHDSTIGLRCPDDPFVRELARRVGPLATTSANLHGLQPPPLASAVASIFPSIATIIDGGPRSGSASTVVDLTGDSATVLRTGHLSAAKIDEALVGGL